MKRVPTAKELKRRTLAPLTLEQAAEELRDLGLNRDLIKYFATNGRVNVYRLGGRRLIQRAALQSFRAWLEERIAADPEWFEIQLRRAGSRARITSRVVVTGTSSPPPRPAAFPTASALPARVVQKAPSSKPAKVATFGDSPRLNPPRVVVRGQR